jgi:hypothetical protein
MYEPSLFILISSLCLFLLCLYYLLFKKSSMKTWPKFMKFNMYADLVLSSSVIIWIIVYIVMTRVRG